MSSQGVEEDVSGLRWKIGWSPWLTIIGISVLAVLIGSVADIIAPMFVLGLLAGVAIYYWGTQEVNNHYKELLQQFISESERKGARGINVDDANSYSLTYGHGDSPFFVEPSRTYETTTIIVSDTSVNVNLGAEYDMKNRSSVAGGTNRELYYDQISAVESHQDGSRSVLEIGTSGGDNIEIGSTSTDTVDAAMRDVREKVREAKS